MTKIDLFAGKTLEIESCAAWMGTGHQEFGFPVTKKKIVFLKFLRCFCIVMDRIS